MAERSQQKVCVGGLKGAESLRLCHWQRRHGAKASAEGKEGGSSGGGWGVLGPFQMDHNMGKLFRTVLICLQPLFFIFYTLAGLSQSLVTDFVSAGVFWEG